MTIDTGPGGTASGGTTNAQIADFTFSVVETGTVVLRCSLDGAEFRVCSSPKQYLAEELAAVNNGIIDGLHTFEVEALKHDLLVPADAPALWEWTIEDIDAPTVAILGTPPAEIAEGTQFELTLTSNDPTADFECSVNGAEFAGCASAPPGNVASLSLDPGLNTVAVRAVDQAAIAEHERAGRGPGDGHRRADRDDQPPHGAGEPDRRDDRAVRLHRRRRGHVHVLARRCRADAVRGRR